MVNPKKTEAKLNQLIKSWTRFAPTKTFAGMTLAQFKDKIKDSLDSREVIANLESDLNAEQANRDTADASSLFAASLVVNSIKGDPEHGEDSPLYEAIGYVRKSVRKTGVKRTKKAATPA
jgi:hypothetical protein